MKAEHIMSQEDFKKCLDFHGHLCPGLAIGYRAAKGALDWLKENRSEDEELVAIVETDACSADAVQVITGCTFGKGNFFYKDHGKQVLSLASRKSGRGVRIAMKAGAFQPTDRHLELIARLRSESATDEDAAELRKLHRQRSCDILEMPLEELFSLKAISVPVPEKARIECSKTCNICGEPVMGSKMAAVNDRLVCRDCQGAQ
jgi:formylmethanofuran dehydrogenase subunit E